MRLRLRRALAAAVALVAAAAPVLSFPATAEAAACSGTSGVTVVVDFGSLGGGVSTRCAPGDPSSGVDALQRAGFVVTPVNGEAFVCRIDGKPAEDRCMVTPPSTAYWAYWHAKRGGSWTFSSAGAGTYNPAPGTVEGWAFGASRKPSVAPPPLPAPSPTRTTTAPRPTATSGAGVGPTSGHHAGTASTATPGGAANPSASVLGTKTGAPPLPSTGPPATDESTGTETPATATAEPPAGGGSRMPAPLLGLAGLALVGGIGGAAWWRAHRHAGSQ